MSLTTCQNAFYATVEIRAKNRLLKHLSSVTEMVKKWLQRIWERGQPSFVRASTDETVTCQLTVSSVEALKRWTKAQNQQKIE